jgi:2-aminobenzoate-CoA ligase
VTETHDRFVEERLPPLEMQPEFLFTLPELQYPKQLNAAFELVDRAVLEGDADRIAVIDGDERRTYGWLSDTASRIARLLREEEGLVPGNRVFLRGANGAMLYACWLGVLKAGGVVVTTMPLLRPLEIAIILDCARISHAIVDTAGIEHFSMAIEGRRAPLRSILSFGEGGTLEGRLANVDVGFAPYASRSDEPALIAFTSGTTGRPKGCIHFHRDILAVADTFAAQIVKPCRDDVFLTSAPIAFTFGLGASVIFPFRTRAASVTLGRATPAALLDTIERHGVTLLFTAPTAYKEMLGQLSAHDISTLRVCVSAGEHLPQATWERWHAATGIKVIDGIGATEMMHIFISAAADAIRPGATGRPVPGFRACVLDAEGRPQSVGQGRLAVKGPTGCRYLDDPRQANYVHDGWNVTGDTYQIDADGYFWYVARSDDMIVSSGYNIAAPEVENALLRHHAVRECAVIGVPCEARGQLVKAFVVTDAERSDALIKELQDHVKQVIAPYKYPRAIEFVDSLPKTATGKLQRYALRP